MLNSSLCTAYWLLAILKFLTHYFVSNLRIKKINLSAQFQQDFSFLTIYTSLHLNLMLLFPSNQYLSWLSTNHQSKKINRFQDQGYILQSYDYSSCIMHQNEGKDFSWNKTLILGFILLVARLFNNIYLA